MATAREAAQQKNIVVKTYLIGELCALSGLSRSALLYYDSIGLLSPSGRASNNYRVYTESDVDRLVRISAFRDAGVSLAEIRDMLDSNRPGPPKETLEARLREIGEAIGRLRLLREFEALSPEGHDRFLRFIGFGEKEIAGIKEKSKCQN